MARVVQGTISKGFGGLELVIIEFHEWLIKNSIEAYVLVVEGTPIHKNLIQRGFTHSVLSVSAEKPQKEMIKLRKQLDSKETAFLFHRQQGLKHLVFHKYKAKISAMSHTFYDVNKRDLWHRLIFSNVDQWIALTERHKENLIETTAVDSKKICIVPNGVNLQKFTCKFKEIPPSDQIIKIGVIARLDRKKGQDLAIQALKILSEKSNRQFTLHFYGEDTPNEKPTRPELEKLVRQFGLHNQVFFEGYHENLNESLQKLDLVWMPSEKETFGRCIVEAMASGIPVIASEAGGVPDIIRHKQNGILFQTKNANDLVDKTIELVRDQVLFRLIQTSARIDIVEKYNIEDIWLKLFTTILPDSVQVSEVLRIESSLKKSNQELRIQIS